MKDTCYAGNPAIYSGNFQEKVEKPFPFVYNGFAGFSGMHIFLKRYFKNKFTENEG